MRSDGKDLVAALAKIVETGLLAGEGTVDWFRAVLHAVDFGSSEKSPFVHCSTTPQGASKWHQRAELTRGENPEKQLLVELDLWEWTQLGEQEGIRPLGPNSIIDLSTHAAQTDFINSFPDWSGREKKAYDEALLQHPHAFQRALESNEVLVKWRGMIPIQCIHVIDADGGRSGRSLLTHMLERNERVVEHVWFDKIRELSNVFGKANPMSRAGSGDFHKDEENATRSPTDAESEGSQSTRDSKRSVATRTSSKDHRGRCKEHRERLSAIAEADEEPPDSQYKPLRDLLEATHDKISRSCMIAIKIACLHRGQVGLMLKVLFKGTLDDQNKDEVDVTEILDLLERIILELNLMSAGEGPSNKRIREALALVLGFIKEAQPDDVSEFLSRFDQVKREAPAQEPEEYSVDYSEDRDPDTRLNPPREIPQQDPPREIPQQSSLHCCDETEAAGKSSTAKWEEFCSRVIEDARDGGPARVIEDLTALSGKSSTATVDQLAELWNDYFLKRDQLIRDRKQKPTRFDSKATPSTVPILGADPDWRGHQTHKRRKRERWIEVLESEGHRARENNLVRDCVRDFLAIFGGSPQEAQQFLHSSQDLPRHLRDFATKVLANAMPAQGPGQTPATGHRPKYLHEMLRRGILSCRSRIEGSTPRLEQLEESSFTHEECHPSFDMARAWCILGGFQDGGES